MVDNARPHRARIVEEYLEDHGLERMEWPARSPDLNPIEHLWDYLGREVAALNPPPRSLHELKQGLLCVWSSLPIPVSDNLINSMGNRCRQCIQAKEERNWIPRNRTIEDTERIFGLKWRHIMISKTVTELGQQFMDKQYFIDPPSPTGEIFNIKEKKQSNVEKLPNNSFWRDYDSDGGRDLKTQKGFIQCVRENIQYKVINDVPFELLSFANPLDYATLDIRLDLVLNVRKRDLSPTALHAIALETINTRFPPEEWLHIYSDGSLSDFAQGAGIDVFSLTSSPSIYTPAL
ncbi:DDE_3 domain-containing protein [Trichonephila clavipes]|nr:DDE_3 domain-containing protein [Trichonephila clavipes]